MKNKKKIFVISSFVAVAAISGTIAATILGPKALRSFASNAEVWSHYDGVKATAYNKGIKEYWVSCNSHEHQFVAPTGDVTIDEKGAPTQEFINSLESTDDRLINKYPKVIDFEDGNYDYFIPHASTTSLSIADGEGIDGSKALKLSCIDGNGSVNLSIAKAFLESIFTKEDIATISFAARGETATSTFRSRPGTVAYDNTNATTQNGGLSTSYKTFYITRDMYNKMVTANDFMFLQAGACPTVYLDEFRASYFDNVTNRPGITLDSGGLYANTAGKEWYLRDAKNQQADFQVTTPSTGIVSDVTRDYINRSEGIASVSVAKTASGNVNFVLGRAASQNFNPDKLPDAGIFFDFYAYNAVNATWTRFHSDDSVYYGTGTIGDGRNPSQPLYYDFYRINNPVKDQGHTINAGQWVTLHVSKAQMTNGTFMFMSGGATGTFNVDNIRLATGALESFEHAYPFSFPNYGSNNGFCGAVNYKIGTDTSYMATIDSKKNYLVESEWNRCSSAEITDEMSSDGDYSLKLNLTGNTPIRVSPSYEAILYKDGGSLSLDLYTDDISNNKIVTLGGRTITVTKDQWTTITLTLNDFIKNSAYSDSGRFTENSFGAGTLYIDNIRYIPA